ncbi:MAG: hypothetical protein HOG89_05430 [Candidatus Peribacter sp.]|jgi:hypothetical protein|nr:hypothetical protein [Candidatus Peribacter sp.]MBT4393439.1 hypothetical protein [Candidatus Peribacter sp.]MBT4600550.1 hypothetical protein [Candidatus Peribacter sp.]MBT5149445.1 hypothetical protein [Candidatus Peribacter sp.]MBT5638575.1 hypothetical protein [Candidatus Peribacter sp.]
MNRLITFAGSATLILLFTFVNADSAYALAGSDPNSSNDSTQRNFRRPVGLQERYRRNKRSLERRTRDQFTNPVDGQSTFHRREDYLRDAYQKRFDADLKSREYSGVRRANVRDDRETRSLDSGLRRLRRAERGGGVRLRALSTPAGTSKTAQDRRERAAAYRKKVVENQIQRYSESDNVDCSVFSGRRQATCYYNLRRDN